VPCPLCNGPVPEDESSSRPPDSRVEIALWMAIEALDNEATALRVGSSHHDAARWADEAVEQVALLRGYGRRPSRG
jgi:hypothetical protein